MDGIAVTRTRGWRYILQRAALLLLGLVVLLALVLAAFPWGVLRQPLTRYLSGQLGRPVTIAEVTRLDTFSFEPRLRLTGVRVPQPSGTGDMLRIAAATVRFSVLPLLRGHVVPTEVDVSGLLLDLRRDGQGRWNTDGKDRPAKSSDGKSPPPRLRHLRITDSIVRVDDAKRHLVLSAQLAADGPHGLTVTGSGTLRGKPIQIAATGGTLENVDPDAPYKFSVKVVSELVSATGSGTMDHVLDTGHFTATARTHGQDLKYLDDLIQAGVPATQDFDLAVTVRHDDRDWNIKALSGTIGRSDVTGSLSVVKRDGRSILDGRIVSNAFDFDDLSSDEQRARAAEEERRTGKRVIPATDIHFEKLSRTDGVIRFTAHHLLMKGKTPFRSLAATLTMDHRVLTVAPLQAGLAHGTLGGRITVDHRSGDPKLDVQLKLAGGRIEDIFTEAKDASAPLDGRIALHGTGRTVRTALGQSSGTIDLISRGGEMLKSVATLGGGDVLRGAKIALSGERHEMTPIRCIVGRFTARQGKLGASDLILDTTVMRAGGSGTVDLGNEAIALTLTGRSKHPDALQSTVPIHVGGTLALPTFDVVPVDRSPPKKGLLGQIVTVIKSLRTRDDPGRDEVAPDAPCGALAAAILK